MATVSFCAGLTLFLALALVTLAHSCDLPNLSGSAQQDHVHLQNAYTLLRDLERCMEFRVDAIRHHPEFLEDEISTEARRIPLVQYRQPKHVQFREMLAAEVCDLYLREWSSFHQFRGLANSLHYALDRQVPMREFLAIFMVDLNLRFGFVTNQLYKTFLSNDASAQRVLVPKQVQWFLKQLIVMRLVEWEIVRRYAAFAEKLRDDFPELPQELWDSVDECLTLMEVVHSLSPILLRDAPAMYLALRFPTLLDIPSPELKEQLRKRLLVDMKECMIPILEKTPDAESRQAYLQFWKEWQQDHPDTSGLHDPIDALDSFFIKMCGISDSLPSSTLPLWSGPGGLVTRYHIFQREDLRQFSLPLGWAFEACKLRVQGAIFRLERSKDRQLVLQPRHFALLAHTAAELYAEPLGGNPEQASTLEAFEKRAEWPLIVLFFHRLGYAGYVVEKKEKRRKELGASSPRRDIAEVVKDNVTGSEADTEPEESGKEELRKVQTKNGATRPPVELGGSSTSGEHLCQSKLKHTWRIMLSTRQDVSLPSSDFHTLCLLLGKTKGQVTWKSFLALIVRLGGEYEMSSGSRTRIRLFGGTGILDRPHGRKTELWNGKLYAARRLLVETFGVDLRAFQLTSSNGADRASSPERKHDSRRVK